MRTESTKGHKMRLPTLAAAALMAATFGLHLFGGGPEFHQPIQASTLDLPLRAVSAVLWHAVSITLALQAAALLWLAKHPNRPMAILLTAIQIGYAGLFLFYGQTMLGTIWQLGQWTIFLALAALILWGAAGSPKANGAGAQ
jgi:hypothetical protein